jgi:hypothetical protein
MRFFYGGLFVAKRMTRDQLVRLARLGAAARLEDLRREIAAIEALLGGARGRARFARRTAAAEGAGARRRGRRRRSWTAAQRKEAADRMKRYWAKRKAGSKK